MHNINTNQDHLDRTFSRLQITDLDALSKEDSQIFEPGL